MSLKDKLLDGHDDLRERHFKSLQTTVYAKRYTLSKQQQIHHLYDSKTERLKPEALVEIVVRFALDEEGNKLLSREDVNDLMRKADMHVISDIANWIVGGDEDMDVADHEKNSDGAASD